MAALTVQNITATGTAPSFASAATGGDYAIVDHPERSFAHVKNGSGGSLTVTVTGKVASNQGQLNNNAVAIPAGEERIIPFARWELDDAARVDFTYSGITSLTIGVFQVGD